jgi:hypothetical protein
MLARKSEPDGPGLKALTSGLAPLDFKFEEIRAGGQHG